MAERGSHLPRSSAREVKDVSASKGFDDVARRGGTGLHVEVKGLVGSLPQVLLTTSEKRHAQQWQHLAIATGVGTSGSSSPWRIDDGDLEPVQFRWSPREAREGVGSQG
jgi:hypothetical protein